MPLVSIGLPVYNGERFLDEAIDSILNQTFEDFELIKSDNASSDETGRICKLYEKKDSRIRYYRNKKNLGAAYNYNRVFKLSKGKYFRWAAHDDVIAPTNLERCVEVLNQNPSVILCYPNTVIIDEHACKLYRYDDGLDLTDCEPCDRFRKCLFRVGGRCNAIFGLFRSSTLKKTNLIGNYNASDYIFLAEIALLGKGVQIPEELFFRRDYEGTSCRANVHPTSLATWFDPTRKKKIVLPVWRRGYEYTASIINADINSINRIVCFLQMIKWIRNSRKKLWKEFQTAVKQF